MSHRRLAPFLAALLVVAACTPAPSPPEPLPFGHVHGLGINPADDRLYIASHTGVYRVVDDQPRLIADRRQDTMGFDIVGPDQFIGSGHPADPDEPNPLGFITSADAGKTWTTVSLQGQSDLHAIDVAADDSIVAVDVEQEAVIRSVDEGKTWTTLLEGVSIIDIAALPTPDNELFITTTEGRTLVIEANGGPSPRDSPGLTYIDATPAGDVIGLGAEGRVWRGRGDTWTELGQAPGAPAAISTAAETWYVATTEGIFESRDDGMTWDSVFP